MGRMDAGPTDTGDGVLSKKRWLLCLFVGLASLAMAQGPEGSGSVGLGGTYTLPYSGNGPFSTYEGNGLGLNWGAPLSQGFALRGDFSWFRQYGSYSGYGSFWVPPAYSSFANANFTEDYTTEDYTADLQLDYYLAGHRGLPYKPGRNANADGWLYWPSFSLGYGYHVYNTYDTFAVDSPISQIYATNYYSTIQHYSFGMTWPLATWMSFGAAYRLQLLLTRNQSWPVIIYHDMQNNFGGSVDVVSFVNFYLNLVPAAGATLARPFLPHYGRVGQLLLSLREAHQVGSYYSGASANSYTLFAGAPLSASLAAGLAVTTTDNLVGATTSFPMPLQFSASVTWAFGDPEHRP